VKQFSSTQWRDILAYNDLDSAEKIWDLDAEWFEEPNYCRNGWSGVSRLSLKTPNGANVGVFLKRQEDHTSRTWAHPIAGMPTFEREYNNIVLFKEHAIPTLDVVYFKSWRIGKHQRAILMTKELAGYQPLSSKDYEPDGCFAKTRAQKKAIFEPLATLMQQMHNNRLMHNCLYGKHIYAKNNEGVVDLRLIDLEKAKSPMLRKTASFRDLYSLNRHATHWPNKDKLAFFKLYCGENKLSTLSRSLLAKIVLKASKKSKP
jgi:hypothetical protein